MYKYSASCCFLGVRLDSSAAAACGREGGVSGCGSSTTLQRAHAPAGDHRGAAGGATGGAGTAPALARPGPAPAAQRGPGGGVAGRSRAVEEPPPFWCRRLGLEGERSGSRSDAARSSLTVRRRRRRNGVAAGQGRATGCQRSRSFLLFSGGGFFGTEEMDSGARPGGGGGAPGQSREYKLVMLGAGGVGKSGAYGSSGRGRSAAGGGSPGAGRCGAAPETLCPAAGGAAAFPSLRGAGWGTPQVALVTGAPESSAR